MTEITRLPMPLKLEPAASKRTLMASVRIYFYALYNSTNEAFKKFLASVGNDDAETGNRLFDRHAAMLLIKEAAAAAKDAEVGRAKEGEIYRCVVRLMKHHDLGLKVRRSQYKQLTRSSGSAPPAAQPAE